MRRHLTALTALALVGAGVGVPTAANASHTAGMSRLVEIRAGSHPGFDRLVFEFSGKLPEQTFVQWVPRITRDGSGARVPAGGNAFLQIGLFNVTGLTATHNSSYGPADRTFALRNLAQVVHAGEFEGMLSFGAAYMARTSVTVSKLTNPSRVILDVASNYQRTSTGVRLLNGKRYANGTTPYVRSVARVVPAGAPAGGALHRLFAGPTAAERANGLRLVASGATGFKKLSISGGVARVHLVGGCTSGGSTFTIANLIRPTLRALPSVRWVKIYSPSGKTQHPTGQQDSIPSCLEP